MASSIIQEAKKHLFKLIERASNGKEIVITRAGKLIARLLPIFEEQIERRIPGIDNGKMIINFEFDEPLREFEE